MSYLNAIQVVLSLCVVFSHSAKGDRLLIERNARPLLAEGTSDALTPWETPLEGFFVRSHHNTLPSSFDDSWQIQFSGQLAHPTSLAMKDLKAMTTTSFHAVLECSGNGRSLFSPSVTGVQWKLGAVGNAEWTGVELSQLIRQMGVQKQVRYVTFEGFDEPVIKSDKKFVRSIPIDLLLETKSILAWKMNREPLPVSHGGPVRLVMPGIYGQNWVKWVTKIHFSSEPDSRAYASKAYRMPTRPLKPTDTWDPVKDGRPIDFIKVQSIFTSPKRDENYLNVGPTSLRGKAFTGTGTIKKLEISLDGGLTWKASTLSPAKDYAWQEFEFPFTVEEGKTYEALSRATDSFGHTQPLTQEWNPKGYLYHAVDRMKFVGSTSKARLFEGETLALNHCQTCHSLGIAESQRVSKKEWIKIVQKMADYGLRLTETEEEKIASFFAARYPETKPIDDEVFVDLSRAPNQITHAGTSLQAGTSEVGEKLFSSYCAGCHGGGGMGGTGPQLRGRFLTDATFWSTVSHGKRDMPPFHQILSASQIQDIKAWLDPSPRTTP